MNGTASERQEFLLVLQAGRGVAAFSVYLFHSAGGIFTTSVSARYWLDNLFSGLSLGVAFFFVLSGLVMFTAHKRDIDQPSRALRYFLKRFLRIYPIYWLVILPYVLRPNVPRDAAAAHPLAVLSSFLLVPVKTFDLILNVSWTLQHEVLFYLLFSLLLFSRRLGVFTLTLWMAGSVVLLMCPQGGYLGWIFTPLHLLFGVGIGLGTLQSRQWCPHPAKMMSCGLFVLTTAIGIQMKLGGGEGPQLIGGVGSALCILGGVTLERHGRLHVPRWLFALGEASYVLYLVHVPVMEVVARVTRRWPADNVITAALLLFGQTAVVTSCALSAHYIIERPMLNFFRRKIS